MVPALVNFTAYFIIVSFFLRWVTVKWPESGIGKALAFIH